MKVVQINSVCGVGSTGRIAEDISKHLNKNGIENYILYGVGKSDYSHSLKFGNDCNVKAHQLATRVLGKHGFYSSKATEELVDILERINPDIVHLHNIHGHFLNVEILFNYLATSNKKVVWTLHDCWGFTGHCAYYDFVNCDKWKSECSNCPALQDYPRSLFFDRSKESYKDKKRLFNSCENITIVTPSQWLAGEVKNSFLKKYPVKVINNGIDLTSFKPTISDFRCEHGIEDKFIILGVASAWEKRKGFNFFIDIAKILNDDEMIVLVGLTDVQKRSLPSNIIGISKTNSIKELAEIYSSADVFLNPTLEDNFPTTNIESLACGTPVITFDTGGSPESINKETGVIVKKRDAEELLVAVRLINKDQDKIKSCVDQAKKFNKIDRYGDYLTLYNSIGIV